MNDINDFKQDLENNKRESNRADFFKLQNGDNKIVILTNPIGYSELFNVGIAYEGCGYAEYASRRYKAYIKDLSDNMVKIANFSYTVAKKLAGLSDGARTKFDGFPMPYIVNLKTEKAGTKEVNTEVLADEDYTLSDEDVSQLQQFDTIMDIIERLKASQKKKVESDTVMQDKIAKKISEIKDTKEKNKKKQSEMREATVQVGEAVEDGIEYPDGDEIPEGDIPF